MQYFRVETIKMMALPLTLPQTFFTAWNKLIANFIWNGKKHRVKYKLLIQAKEKGGVGAQNLTNYYYAVQILTIMKWMRSDPEEKQINIEKELTKELIGIIFKDRNVKAISEDLLYKKYNEELEANM